MPGYVIIVMIQNTTTTTTQRAKDMLIIPNKLYIVELQFS